MAETITLAAISVEKTVCGECGNEFDPSLDLVREWDEDDDEGVTEVYECSECGHDETITVTLTLQDRMNDLMLAVVAMSGGFRLVAERRPELRGELLAETEDVLAETEDVLRPRAGR